MKRISLISVLLLGLLGCQPKGSSLYVYPSPQEHSIDRVVVVVDYLNLKDDVGKYWDFDSHYHQATLNQLLAQIDSKLQHSGFPKINSYLLSSGLLIKNEFAVEHYIKGQIQNELLYPPFIMANQGINSEQITQHQEFLTIMVKYIGQRRHHENDELSHRGMQMGYHFESMELPDNTAILYVHIDQSAPGIIKQLGTYLLLGAAANQADYGHVTWDASTNKNTSLFFVHQSSGQILWKNHSKYWTPEQNIKVLFTDFPKRQQQ